MVKHAKITPRERRDGQGGGSTPSSSTVIKSLQIHQLHMSCRFIIAPTTIELRQMGSNIVLSINGHIKIKLQQLFE